MGADGLWIGLSYAEDSLVTARVLRLERHWNWRVSAHFRIGSLLGLWAVLLFMGPLGWLFAPIAGLRSALSFAQTLLNVRLGREVPLDKQTRFDWVLVGGIFAGAYLAVGIGHLIGNMHAPILFVPLLVPFSVLQARMTVRSYRAAEIAETRPATIVRLEDYRRAERGELRAA
ncbi:MAG: hypothetical protein AB7J35_02275 [Dehalococcoidia bacterium]